MGFGFQVSGFGFRVGLVKSMTAVVLRFTSAASCRSISRFAFRFRVQGFGFRGEFERLDPELDGRRAAPRFSRLLQEAQHNNRQARHPALSLPPPAGAFRVSGLGTWI